MSRRRIKMEELSDSYSITNDGKVYSHLKDRYLKGAINGAGYLYYYLKGKSGKFRWYFAHRLVYMTYVGPIKDEINHIDRNKMNNHVDNLEDVTHRDNIRKARALNPWESGRKKGWPISEEAKEKIGLANGRAVVVIDTDWARQEFASIGRAAKFLGISYSTAQRHMKKQEFRQYSIGKFRIKFK